MNWSSLVDTWDNGRALMTSELTIFTGALAKDSLDTLWGRVVLPYWDPAHTRDCWLGVVSTCEVCARREA